MPTQKRRRTHSRGRPDSGPTATAHLQQLPLDAPLDRALPVVRLRSVRRHPHLYSKLIDGVDPAARAGDLVAVYTPQGELLGHGLYNPRAEIVVRMLNFRSAVPGQAFWDERLRHAVKLRRDLLGLDADTDAYRVVHAEADGLSGLVVDRYRDVLSAEVFSLAMFQRSQALLTRLSAMLGIAHRLVQVPAQTHGQEGFRAESVRSPGFPEEVVVTEFETKFRIGFDGGHKTGFFCDQRDNRRRLAEFCRDKTVLDLCCYTGGFALQAKRLGNAADVTAVDLDEKAIAVARDNARLNQQKVNFIHADAFGYMRDMIANGRTFDVVVLDPPKLIRNRREIDEGTKTHLDLNRLALHLVADGGLLLSCTCSGLLDEGEFLQLLHTAARQAGKAGVREGHAAALGECRLQILAKTGAAPDHPVATDCPETEYLKAVWMRVLRT
jgi:23S rRNA (cytosine1962-C5)-methyltransferase